MALRSSSDQYGAVAVTIHWLAALSILFALLTGFRAAAAEDVATKAALLRLHLPLAALVLVLTVVRIVWWLGIDRTPAAIAAPLPQQWIARAVHLLFYVVVLGMVASGIGMMLASRAAPAIFSPDVAALPDFWCYRPRIPHGFGARLLVALLVVHVAAALYHHVVLRDRVFARIWFVRTPKPTGVTDEAT